MGNAPKIALRPLTEKGQKHLQSILKATSERVDVVRRARAFWPFLLDQPSLRQGNRQE